MRARRQATGRGSGPARIGAVLLVAAGSLFLAWWVVKTSTVDVYVRRNAPAAAVFAPDNPRVKIALAMLEFRLRNGAVSPAGQRGAASALARSPLSAEPFLLAAVADLAAGRESDGERLLAESKRRNPRARTARLLLLDRYLRHHQAVEAGVEIAVLNRLIPRAGEVLVPELARMVRDPKTGASLIGVLQRDPVMQQAVLARLASTGADPDLIVRIAGTNAATSPTADGLPWQRLLLSKLVEAGDLARAQRLWRSFAGLPAADDKGLYDGAFRGLPGAPPFNWQLNSGSAGVAERVPKPGLQVEYYGRENADMATQLLMLPPGRYRLSFTVEGNAKGEGSRLAWTLLCRSGAQPLVEVALADVNYVPKAVAAEFAVPAAGCTAQWLKLKGSAGEFVDDQSVTISNLTVAKAEGR